MTQTINTIQDLLDYYYPSSAYFEKTDAPVLSTTTAALNVVFGEAVWATFNQESNVLGILPKTPWKKSGWRLQTARAGTTADGGVAENGAIPDTIKGTFVEVTNTLKTVSHSFDLSEVLRLQALSDDDSMGDLQFLRETMGIKHKEAMNQQLVVDVSAGADAATANYAGKDGFETLDRVISNDSEEDAFGGSYTTWFDIFGLDRDTGTTYDAYVDHNSGTDRSISDSMIRTAWTTIGEDGGNTTVLFTGWDTYSDIIALYSDQVRYNVLGETKAQVGVNGIQTDTGVNTGLRMTSVYEFPIIRAKDTTKDGASRVYLLDTSDPEGFGEPRLQLSIAQPTLYFESGMASGNPFAINKFGNEGAYATFGEIKCTYFQAQGKIRDLS